MLDSLDISAVHFSKAYLRHKKRILAEQKKKQEYNYNKFIWNRMIIAALISVSIILGAVMSISAVRESLWKTILNWYEQYIDVHFENDVEEDLPPKIIEEVRKPTDIPEGCEEVEIYNDLYGVYIEYYIEDNFIFFFQQALIQDGTLWINGENVIVSVIKINVYEAKLSQNTDNKNICQIIWNDGDYYYMISGYTLSTEQLIYIASSVK